MERKTNKQLTNRLPNATPESQLQTAISAYINSLGNDASALATIKTILRKDTESQATRIQNAQIHTQLTPRSKYAHAHIPVYSKIRTYAQIYNAIDHASAPPLVKAAFVLLVETHLAQNNSVVRHLGFRLFAVLFENSANFRRCAAASLPRLVHLTIVQHPFPPPTFHAEKCRNLAFSKISEWTNTFGYVLPELYIAQSFLRKNNFLPHDSTTPSLNQTRDAAMRADREQRDRHAAFVTAVAEMSDKLSLIHDNIDEMNRLFSILVDDYRDNSAVVDKKGKAPMTHKDMAKTYGLGTSSYSLEITIPLNTADITNANIANPESPENEILYASLRECRKLQDKYLDSVRSCIRVVSLEQVESQVTVGSHLKQLLDIRNLIETANTKADFLLKSVNEAKNNRNNNDGDDEDFDDEVFEVIPI
ncbi:hypothetical protein HK100_007933, partial [Physocladia obscura]